MTYLPAALILLVVAAILAGVGTDRVGQRRKRAAKRPTTAISTRHTPTVLPSIARAGRHRAADGTSGGAGRHRAAGAGVQTPLFVGFNRLLSITPLWRSFYKEVTGREPPNPTKSGVSCGPAPTEIVSAA